MSGRACGDAAIGFGRSAGRTELRQIAETNAAHVAIQPICQAVIAGDLTEWRQDERACRCDVRWPYGESLLRQVQPFAEAPSVLPMARWPIQSSRQLG